MQHRSRSLLLTALAAAALTTSACADVAAVGQAGATSTPQAVAETSSSPSAAASSSAPATAAASPTEVVTDAPVSTGPTKDGVVFLTGAEWDADEQGVVVRGYLEDVVEDDGVCTLTLTAGGTTRTAERNGTSNVTSTSCGALTVPGAELSPGAWTAVVTYRSSTSRGTSDPVEVAVP